MAIDVELLRAWYAAFPFAIEAFEHGIYVLERGKPRAPSGALAQAADRWISVRAHGRSLDGLARLREQMWFGAEQSDPLRSATTLAQLLGDIADLVLSYDGCSIVLRQRGHGRNLSEATDHASNASRFRWLTLALPQDLLVAAYCARQEVMPTTIDVRFGSIGLERVLATGVAETHMHVSNGVDSLFVWKRWLRSLAEPIRSSTSVRRRSDRCATAPLGGISADDPFGPPLGSMDRLERTALAAAVLRAELNAWFATASNEHDTRKRRALPGTATERRREHARGLAELLLLSPCRDDCDDSDTDTQRVVLRNELLEQLAPRLTDPRQKPWKRVALFEDTLERCPTVHPADGTPDAEFRFMRTALRKLMEWERDGRSGLYLSREAQLFWQYLRLRVAVFRYTTQEPGVSGLDWFRAWDHRLKSFYSRKERLNSVGNAFLLHSRGAALSAMELRVPPESSEHDAYNLFTRTLDSALSTMHGLSPADADRLRKGERPAPDVTPPPPCEVGLVLHFVKQASNSPPTRPSSGKRRMIGEGEPPELIRYDRWLRDSIRQYRVLDTLFRRHPLLVVLVRGFDVASRELSMPTWPTLVPLALCARSAQRACEAARRRFPSVEIQPPRTTYHVGEDYRRSVEGLRRVHELIEFGALGANDRIGHGLSLGDDLERRHREQPVVYQPAEDRLDDLLWEFDRYQRGDLQDTFGRVNVVRGEIDHLVRSVLYNDTSPAALRMLLADSLAQTTTAPEWASVRQWIDRASSAAEDHCAARRERHDPALIGEWVRRLGRRATPTLGARHTLLARYLTDPEVRERGLIPVRVESSEAELAFLKVAQRWLRNLIAVRQITIESNPSSNLLVGDFQCFPDLPTFRMHPLPSQQPSLPRLAVSLNTDDPLTFATNLAHEYEYMFASLLRANIPSEEALAWINSVRECGMRSRFTIDASKRPTVLARLRHQVNPYRPSDRYQR